jgi:hypothetical protein
MIKAIAMAGKRKSREKCHAPEFNIATTTLEVKEIVPPGGY